MNSDERFIYYIGDFFGSKHEIIVKPEYKTFKLNDIFHYTGCDQQCDNFPFDKGYLSPGFWRGYNGGFPLDFECLSLSSDGYKSDELPVITKSRIIGVKNAGILFKGEYVRHWGIFSHEFKEGDKIQWENKKMKLFGGGFTLLGFGKRQIGGNVCPNIIINII